jgi:hypothetical protein
VHKVTEGTVQLLKRHLPDLQPYARAHPPPRDHLIVFFHIPRTAGDSMRTHLFNVADWDFTPFDATPEPLDDAAAADLARHRVIKGFLSRPDLDKLPARRKVFTFLRDPVERALSLYYFLECGRRNAGRTLSIREFFTSDVPVIASYACNGMTWQLGDTLDKAHRTLSGEEALRRAKATLQAMDFIGYYEELLVDSRTVRRTLFNDLSVNPFFPRLFELGAVLTRHRQRVRKYASTLDPDDLALVRDRNALDIELYAHARSLSGRGTAIHDTYGSWGRSMIGRRS